MPNGVRMNSDFPRIEESERLYRRARGLVPAGTQTLAKGPGQYVRGVAPKYLAGAARPGTSGTSTATSTSTTRWGSAPSSSATAHPAVDRAIRRSSRTGSRSRSCTRSRSRWPS